MLEENIYSRLFVNALSRDSFTFLAFALSFLVYGALHPNKARERTRLTARDDVMTLTCPLRRTLTDHF